MRTLVRWYHSAPIRFRVAAIAFTLGSLLVAVVVQVTVQTSADGVERQFEDRTATLVGVVTAMSVDPLLTTDYAQHNELLQQLAAEEGVLTLDLVNLSGQIVSSSDPSRVGLGSAATLVEVAADDHHPTAIDPVDPDHHPIVVNPVIAVSGQIGTVAAVFDTTEIDRQLAAERRRGLVSGLLGVCVVAMVSLVGGRVLTKRLSDLESQLDLVDDDGLPCPVDVNGDDEIARLAAALNQRTLRIRDAMHASAHARDQLQSSESKLQLALAAAADAVIELDLATDKISFWGQNSTAGWLRDLGASNTGRRTNILHPDDREPARKALMNAVAGSMDPVELEVRVPGKQDQWRILLLRIQTIADEHGAPARVVVASVDVTDRRLTELHLARADKMRTIGRLAAGLAHELNNARAVTRLRLSLLQRPDRDRSLDDERIADVVETHNDGSAMVQRLLLAAAPQPARPTRVGLTKFIESRTRLVRTMLGSGIELHLDMSADRDVIEIDEVAVQQLLLNLAKNASDAMQGDGSLTIHMSNPSATTIAIEVSDTGPGIDAAVADTLFDPFVTTKPLGAGTGLGLATTFSAVTDAGGTITAANNNRGGKNGSGAVFTITLPLAQEAEVVPNRAGSATSTAPIAGKRILLVDDNDALLDGLNELLTDVGYDVSTATTIDEAVRMVAKSNPFDLLLTDVGLPDGSGLEVHNHVEQVNPDIRTLFMSAFLPVDWGVNHSDGSRFLQKPFSNEAVLGLITSSLQGAAPQD